MMRFFRKLIQNNLFHSSFQIYTDGSQKNGWGSWAFVVIQNDQVIHEASGRVKQASSNQMEFQAALNALKFLPEKACVQIFTDSQILVRAMTRTKNPKAFSNLITELLSLDRQISWHWVKAHSGIQFNERCDELCIQARQAKPGPLSE